MDNKKYWDTVPPYLNSIIDRDEYIREVINFIDSFWFKVIIETHVDIRKTVHWHITDSVWNPIADYSMTQSEYILYGCLWRLNKFIPVV